MGYSPASIQKHLNLGESPSPLPLPGRHMFVVPCEIADLQAITFDTEQKIILAIKYLHICIHTCEYLQYQKSYIVQ